MAGRCPHLGLAGNRYQVVAAANPRHRCYLRSEPERIGTAHQDEICLTSGYRRCRRLRAAAIANLTASTPATSASAAPVYTTLHKGRVERKRIHHRWSLTELVVAVLAVAILLACSFVGYLAAYRAQIGSGMGAPLPVAQAPESSAPAPRATLVPTFTPTPLPTIPLPTSDAATPEPEATVNAVVTEPSAPTSVPEPVLSSPTPSVRQPAGSPPTRLSIPKISLDIPVLPVGVKTINDVGGSRVVWADVPNAGGFHQTSAYPGNPGNTVINGHRDILGSVFRNLNKVEIGDEIKLYVGDVEYPYYVTERLIVPEAFASARQREENLRLIGYMPEERLTLITCTPIGLATHRLLVIAKPPPSTGLETLGSEPGN